MLLHSKKEETVSVDEKEFTEKIEYIVAKLKEKGYFPYEQLAGYVELNNPKYITRHGNARKKIKEIDVEYIRLYLKQKGIEV